MKQNNNNKTCLSSFEPSGITQIVLNIVPYCWISIILNEDVNIYIMYKAVLFWGYDFCPAPGFWGIFHKIKKWKYFNNILLYLDFPNYVKYDSTFEIVCHHETRILITSGRFLRATLWDISNMSSTTKWKL